MNDLLEIGIQILAFALVFTVSVAGVRLLLSQMAVRRRLGQAGAASAPTGDVFRKDRVENPLLAWVQSATSAGDSAEGIKLRRELTLAGFTHPSAPVWYVILRFGSAIGLPLIFLVFHGLTGKQAGAMTILIALGLCGLGLIAPRALLDNRVRSRREQLEHQFPDALDLMVVCVQAGLGLEAAFLRVAQEVTESHPRIAEEFSRLSEEFYAGRSRPDALRAMAERNDVAEINAFAALLIQTDALGASLGQTLRVYAAEMRETRFLKAEEKAMRIPVLMTIPLVACILPVIMTALLLPAAIDVVRILLPALAGRGGG